MSKAIGRTLFVLVTAFLLVALGGCSRVQPSTPADTQGADAQVSLKLGFGIEGLAPDGEDEYILDEDVFVYSGSLDEVQELEAGITQYISRQGDEVSEWISLSLDQPLSDKVGCAVWIAEYYVGHEEDTNLCLDAVVMAGEFSDGDNALILHTVRDADLDMNSDTDYGAKILELFATIEVERF